MSVDGLDPGAVHQQDRILVRSGQLFAVIMGMLCLVFVAVGSWVLLALCSLAVGGLVWGVSQRARIGLEAAAHWVVLGAWLCIMPSVVISGGFATQGAFWLLTLPAVAGFLGGLRVALIWSVVSWLSLMCFIALHGAGIALPEWVPADPGAGMMAVQVTGMFGVISGTVAVFISDRRRALAHASDVVARLRAEIDVRRDAEAAALHAQDRIAEQARQLEHAQRMEAFGQLAGGIAHDFNNMLGAILGTAELAVADLAPDAPESLRDDLAEIGRVGTTASVLTHQLLAFSRQQVLRRKVVDLRGVVKDMARLSTRVFDAAIRVEAAVPDSPCLAWVDRAQIEQVLLNLMLNARDAMPDGGHLELRLALLDDDDRRLTGLSDTAYWAIEVEDSGAGIPPDQLDRIFEPFFTTKAPDKGTGLGLATSLGIATQSGGRLLVESTVDEGSCFTLILTRREEIDAAARGPDISPPAGGRERVLVVDDNAALRAVTGRMLRAAGYQALEAVDAGSAQRVVAEHPIDLVITDFAMPGTNGLQLVRHLRAEHPAIATLLVSGYAHHAAGIDDLGVHFLPKPFDAAALLRAARAALEGRSEHHTR